MYLVYNLKSLYKNGFKNLEPNYLSKYLTMYICQNFIYVYLPITPPYSRSQDHAI